MQAYIENLEQQGYIFTEPEHSTLRLTGRANEVLFRGERVEMSRPAEVKAEKRRTDTRKKAASTEQAAPEDGLLSALKALRAQLARQEDVPAYIVFSNAVLVDMAAKKPKNMAEFLRVFGVGSIKAARYGEAFLREIAAYQERADGAV